MQMIVPEVRLTRFDANIHQSLQSALIFNMNRLDTACVGFYDRSLKEWESVPQATFLRRAASVGRRLQSVGATKGDYVIIACSSPEAILLGFFGASLIGAVPAILPIRSAFDGPDVVETRLLQTQKTLGNAVFVAVEEREGRLSAPIASEHKSILINLDSIITDDDSLEVPKGHASVASHVQLTSGSTGTGKAVLVTHESLFSNIEALRKRIEVTPYDVFVSWLPLYHDMGLVSKALLGFVLGVDVHIMSPFDFLSQPSSWLKAMTDLRGTVTASPNFGYDLVTKRVTEQELAQIDLSSWKSAFCGAEPIDAKVASSFSSRFAGCNLRPQVFTPSYGLAEATLAVTAIGTRDTWRSITVSRSSLTRLGQIDLADDIANGIDVVSLGRPMDGLNVRIVDGFGSPVESDLQCGEIVVTGSSVAAGWLGDGGVVTPFQADGLHTGDIGFFENGELFVVERLKNIVIRNGSNYSAQVIEQTFAKITKLSVDRVVVLDRDIELGAKLTAVVEVDPVSDRRSLASAVLADADKFEPPLESIVFVKRGVIPRTTSGKKRHLAVRQALNLNRLKVLEEIQVVPSNQPISGADVADELKELQNPRVLFDKNQTLESRVLELVAAEVRAKNIDIPVLLTARLQHDLNFDSLGLLDLAMKMESTFGIHLSRETVAGFRTVRDVANAICDEKDSPNLEVAGLSDELKNIRDSVPQGFVVVEDVRPNRQVKVDGRWRIDLASCNYMGFEEREEIFDAVYEMHKKWGVQRWPTRAVAAPKPLLDLEDRIASLIGVPETMIFPTFTLLNQGVIPLLSGADGAIILDGHAHKSMQETALLASARGTTVHVFSHGDLRELEDKLIETQYLPKRVIAVDGVYSMTGEIVDLASYQLLAKKYDAIVYVDDAHGFGVLGENPNADIPFGRRGNGIVKHLGLDYDRIIYAGGFTKAYSTTFAFVSCPTPAHRELFQSASTLVFGHAVPMAVIAQGNVCLDINEREGDEIRSGLQRKTSRFIERLRSIGFYVESDGTPVVKVVIGNLNATVVACQFLWECDVLMTPAVFPAAALNSGGLRFTVTATTTDAQIEFVLDSMQRLHDRLLGASEMSAPRI